MILLSEKLWFPSVELATSDGLLAIGGDLSVPRLTLAYNSGIFPWFNQGDPIVWYSPDPRMVLFLDELKVSKSMKQLLRKHQYRITFNQSFEKVIEACRQTQRPGQAGTWITNEMKAAYIELHSLGLAKSVEVWREQLLVGGLYGIDLGSVFCGESMFSLESNTSKLALIALTKHLKQQHYKLIDCQVYNKHLASLGAREIPRNEFLKYL